MLLAERGLKNEKKWNKRGFKREVKQGSGDEYGSYLLSVHKAATSWPVCCVGVISLEPANVPSLYRTRWKREAHLVTQERI